MKRFVVLGSILACTAHAQQMPGAQAKLADAMLDGPPRPPMVDMKIDAAMRTQVIDGALAALKKSYVSPDAADKTEAQIRSHVKAGKYDNHAGAIAFANVLTADLQQASHDKHVRLFYSAEVLPDHTPDSDPTDEEKARMHERAARFNADWLKVERLEGNVGYLRLDSFASPSELGPRAAAAMTLLTHTDALVVDLRYNHGGDSDGVIILMSYLYAAEDTVHIFDIYWRPSNLTRQYWNMPDVAGRRYPKKPVWVLTSSRTFSGAESFAYDLQAQKRVTVVGEVTGGGAHPGDMVKVAPHFGIGVPMGRSINPVTKTDWEGTGVRPDVPTTAEKAFDTAYLAALRRQRARVDAKDAPRLSDEIDAALAKEKKALGLDR